MSTDNASCKTSGSCCKSRFCLILFKLIIAGLLTCIATSLWQIEKAVARIAPVAAAKP